MHAPRLKVLILAAAVTAASTSCSLRPILPGVPTAAPSATSTPSPSPTTTPTGTPTPPPHPLSIAAMRGGTYPGSELALEQSLPPGGGFDRSVVSYLSEGLRIDALLTVPHGDPPPSGWPAIVFNHGYIPPRQYRTTERYVAYVNAFARAGYVVIKPDYRGHGDSEGEAVGGYGSPAYTVDVLNALASIRHMPKVDPDRVGMWGHSMGGHITLRSMVVTDTVKAGVIWAGVVASYPDLFTKWHRARSASAAASPPPEAGPVAPGTGTPSSRRWRDDLVARFGSPDANPAFWAEISANSYVADLSGPLQLQHGTADASVPLEFSVILEGQVRAAGKTVELLTYEGDDHNLSRNLSTALARSVEFFDRYVKAE